MARRRAAAVVVEEPEEELEELDDLDDLDELEDADDEDDDEEPEPEPVKSRGRKKAAAPAPAKKAAKRTAPQREPAENVNDSNWLAAYVNDICGTSYDARSMRVLLRKMANDGTISRQVGEDRSRYVFPKGENDPTVKQVLRLAKSGAVEAEKTAGLERAKASAAAKKTAAAPVKAKKKAEAAAPAGKPTRRRREAAE
jgi:hypothetical protein